MTATVASEPTGGMSLQSDGATVGTLAVDQIVHVPRAGANRVPFTGRVVSVTRAAGATTVRLRPVGVEDVFDNLSWDIDTRRAGTQVAGLIAPTGARLALASTSSSNSGREKPLALTQSSTGISGTIVVSRKVTHEGKEFTLFADVELSEVSARFKGTYDKENFLSTQGWAEVSAVVTGKVSGTVGVKGDGTIPALADVITSGDVWKDLKWEGGGLFTLDGLGSADKAGRFPLGGVVLVPGLGATVFRGNLSPEALASLSIAPSVVVWIYADASGALTLSGEVGTRIKNFDFEQGYEFRAIGTSLEARRISASGAGVAEVYGNGTLDVNQRLGLTAAADVLIAGIRPANVAAFMGVDYRGTLSGSGAWRVYPIPELTGSVCASSRVWAGIEVEASFRLKATLSAPTSTLPEDEDSKLFQVGGVVEGRYLWRPLTLFNRDLGSSCVDSLGGAFNGRSWEPYFISFGRYGVAAIATTSSRVYLLGNQPRRLLESADSGQSWVARLIPDGGWGTGPFVRGQTLLLEGVGFASERLRAISRDGGRTWSVGNSRLDDGNDRSGGCLREALDGRVYGALLSYDAATNSYAIRRVESSADLITWRMEPTDPGFRCDAFGTGAFQWTGALPSSSGLLDFNIYGKQAAIVPNGSVLLAAIYSESLGATQVAKLFRSTTDGESWRELSSFTWVPERRVFAPVAYGRTVVAPMGQLPNSGTGSVGNVFLSRNGTTFSINASPGRALRTAAVSSSGVFVAAGESGTVVSSEDDGSSWQQRAISTSARIQIVRWGGGVFMLIDQEGNVFSSSDGRQWTKRGSISSTGFSTRDLTYHDGRWMVASAIAIPGESGSSLIESRDGGATWEYSFLTERFMGLAMCGTTLYASTLEGVLRARTEGRSNWSEVARSPLDALGGDLYLGVKCGNGVLVWPKMYVVSSSALVEFGVSTDGARTWTSRTVTGANADEELTYTGNRWFLTGLHDSLMRAP